MSNPSILVIDCEIVNMIPDKKKPKIEGMAYCEGWHDFKGMGISVVGTYSYPANDYRAHTEDNSYDRWGLLNDLLAIHDIIVGFNCLTFDFSLMIDNGIKIPGRTYLYDIYLEVKKAARATKFAPGYNLDAIAKANKISCKTGHGEFAPKLWQEGKHQEVIDYCLQDVRITKEILDLIMAGKLRNPVKPDEILNVRKPGTES